MGPLLFAVVQLAHPGAEGFQVAIHDLLSFFQISHLLSHSYHERAQFVYADDGLLTIRTAAGWWVVPPQRAVWIPPRLPHQGYAPKGFRLMTLYLAAGVGPVPERCCVLSVDPLLDALLKEAATFGTDYPAEGPEQRLMAVVLDRLARLNPFEAFLPAASDPRLITLTRQLEQSPEDPRSLNELATASGMTARTAARLFSRDTGLTFTQWRQQLRLLKALQALSLGESVTQVALAVGYQDVSAFIQVFKDAFGDTPARYARDRRA